MGKRRRVRCRIGSSSSSSSSSSGSGSDGGGSDSESARRAVGKPIEGGREPEGDEARGPTDKETQFFYMEFAKSNKASCQSCGEAIAEGELRAIIPGLSNSFLHVACVEWSVGHDNRQTCRGCNVKLRKGEGRIGGENAWFGGVRRSFWHPACFQKGLEHFGSALDIKELRGAPRDQPSSGAVQRRTTTMWKAVSRVKISVDLTISSSSEDEPDETSAVDLQCARRQNCGLEAASANCQRRRRGMRM